MLTPGTAAPDFELPSADGRDVSLAGLLADGPVVVYFYPADFTPGCTAQACMVRDLHGELAEAGLRVVGISPQSPESHRKFADRFKLPFVLLSDRGKAVAKRYDANGPFGIGVRRVTYLIRADGTIADAITADLNIGKHRAFIRRAGAEAGPVSADDEGDRP